MNRRLNKGLVAVLLAASVAVTPICARAAGTDVAANNTDRSPASAPSADEPGIEGTWVAKVTNNNVNPPTSFFSLATFLPGGHIMEEPSSTLIRTVAQGQWARVAPREYVRTMFIITFTSPRVFSGMQKVVNFIQLNETGDEYDADAIIEVFDTNGNLTNTVYNTSHAKRCTIATTIPQCMGFVD